jgi:hypothetical protein
MMDAGKALARSGELLVELTSELGLYGGALSAAGAQIRNSGDCVAQAAASCRFKTGIELVCDELREGATCLAEATGKLRQAAEEAQVDEDQTMAKELGKLSQLIHVPKNESRLKKKLAQTCNTHDTCMYFSCLCMNDINGINQSATTILHVDTCAKKMEEAGASIMQRRSLTDVGLCIVHCGQGMKELASSIVALSPSSKQAQESGQRMSFAADRMVFAGTELQGSSTTKNPTKGKAWMKG